MRSLPDVMRERLEGGAATLCLCWIVTRADGVRLGFTDHDRDLEIDGVTCRAASGFTASEAETSLGLAVANSEVAGALSSADLREEDLAAGLYDDARIAVWLVDWTNPQVRHLLRTGSIGRITRGTLHFEAELRGLAHYLDQPRGRVYGYGCDAEVGDARCGVDLSDVRWTGGGTVQAVEGATAFLVDGLEDHAGGWFVHGRLTWVSGANAGDVARVLAHRVDADGVRLELVASPRRAVAAGDAFTVSAGCDRQFETCRLRFGNAVNFRGFPHMPGNDFVMSYANTDDPNDGSPVVG